MPRRRRDNSAPVTFFSFQDVMLSLIGITIVVTLILVLQVTDSAAGVIAKTASREQREEAASQRQQSLAAKVAALEYAVREAQKRPVGDPLAKRASLRQEMLAAGGRLKELEERAAELLRQLRALTLEHPDAGALAQLMELVKMRDELISELEKLERRRRISYIVDNSKPMKPVLLEISGSRIVACDLSADGAAIRIAAGTAAAQVNDALEYYRSVATGPDAYLLLVVKPSGMAQYWSIRAAVDALPEAARPAIGLDLVPEDAYVSELFPSALPGGAP